MITYKNISGSTKTFYGVTFNPDDVKEVAGYVNASGMVRVFPIKGIKSTAPKKRHYNKKASSDNHKLLELPVVADSTEETTEETAVE